MLFGKKKDEEDHKQVNAVKENTPTPMPTSPEPPKENSTIPSNPQSPSNNNEQNSFVNPFSKDKPIESPTNSMITSNPTPQNSTEDTLFPNTDMSSLSGPNNQLGPEEIQEMIDETVEKIIEERWEKLVNNVEKIAKWREQKDEESNMLKEDLVVIKENFEKLEKKLFNKINDYDRNILDVNSEIKALEKVFQKITPTLINNVNELSSIAKEFRSGANTQTLENEKEEKFDENITS